MIMHVNRLGNVLREARQEASLRQQEVAARAGVDQPMVSLYEGARRSPSWETFIRLLRGAGAVAGVRIERLDPAGESGLSIAALARLMAGEPDERRQRLVLEFVGQFVEADPAWRAGLLLEAPADTGDGRWDALLGALAEHFAFHDGVDPPDWCFESGRFLESAWFWVDLPSVRRRALTGTPTAFRRRNVWVDRVDLERV